MGNDQPLSVFSLNKPPDLQELLKEDRSEDCTSCKIVGGGAFLGLAAYSYISGQSELRKQKAKILARKSMFGLRSRQLGITGLSLSLAFLGVWRFTK